MWKDKGSNRIAKAILKKEEKNGKNNYMISRLM